MIARSYLKIRSSRNCQTGMALLICLIFLTALTLLGLSASADAILQEKLASNLREAERARQAAMSALLWAEKWLLELDSPALLTCTEPCEGFHVHTAGDLPPGQEFQSMSWWLNHGIEAGIDPIGGARVKTISSTSIDPPVWLIEATHSIPPAEDGTTDLQVWYRIAARGTGRATTPVSVIESTVIRSWPASGNPGPGDTTLTYSCPGSGAAEKCGRVSWRELR